MSELLPCPFCGSPARTVLNMDDIETWAQCTKRKPSCFPMSSTIIPIADWNKRPAQQQAAAPVSGDVALPDMPFGLASADQRRTYGQQCSDAALERAAKAIDEFADKHLIGDDMKCALALIDVVRALKGGTHV